jgi:hypothetical protein
VDPGGRRPQVPRTVRQDSLQLYPLDGMDSLQLYPLDGMDSLQLYPLDGMDSLQLYPLDGMDSLQFYPLGGIQAVPCFFWNFPLDVIVAVCQMIRIVKFLTF